MPSKDRDIASWQEHHVASSAECSQEMVRIWCPKAKQMGGCGSEQTQGEALSKLPWAPGPSVRTQSTACIDESCWDPVCPGWSRSLGQGPRPCSPYMPTCSNKTSPGLLKHPKDSHWGVCLPVSLGCFYSLQQFRSAAGHIPALSQPSNWDMVDGEGRAGRSLLKMENKSLIYNVKWLFCHSFSKTWWLYLELKLLGDVTLMV